MPMHKIVHFVNDIIRGFNPNIPENFASQTIFIEGCTPYTFGLLVDFFPYPLWKNDSLCKIDSLALKRKI